MSLNQETTDAITAAVAKAVGPLAAAVMELRGGKPLQAVSTPALGGAAGQNRRLEAATAILGCKGIEIPFNSDGSISLHKLRKAMNDAGLDASRQTTAKVSLMEGGYRFVA